MVVVRVILIYIKYLGFMCGFVGWLVGFCLDGFFFIRNSFLNVYFFLARKVMRLVFVFFRSIVGFCIKWLGCGGEGRKELGVVLFF